jgi:hypothetical protein
VNTLLDHLNPAPASFMGDGTYDSASVCQAVIARNPNAKVIVPPAMDAVPGPHATTAPTRRDEHVLAIQKHGRSIWQSAPGYTRRSKAETAISRCKGVIGGTLRSRSDAQHSTEDAIAAKTLNRMRKLGQASFVRVA